MIVRLLTCLAILYSATAVPATAAPPPRVKATSCRSLEASRPASQIWWAAFYGERTGFFDNKEIHHAVGCFTSQATCKAWLYWQQTDWPLMNSVTWCRRGLPR